MNVFLATAQRLGVPPAFVEKDYWVCLVLCALYQDLPADHPELSFKGGTSLSKGFSLIHRFSEDIDIVVSPTGLGFTGARDPLADMSRKARDKLYDELKAACAEYVHGQLSPTVAQAVANITNGCTFRKDDSMTVLVEYPSVITSGRPGYVAPRVKIECGPRSATEPSTDCEVQAYISADIPNHNFDVGGVRTISPKRTFWEKALILHGQHCGFRDAGKLPADENRLSRHYYDVAVISETEIGAQALADLDILGLVRAHNLVAFPQAWKKFEEAVPGTLRVVPQPELRVALERDYRAMTDMIFGDVPSFDWIVERLTHIEETVNRGS